MEWEFKTQWYDIVKVARDGLSPVDESHIVKEDVPIHVMNCDFDNSGWDSHAISVCVCVR